MTHGRDVGWVCVVAQGACLKLPTLRCSCVASVVQPNQHTLRCRGWERWTNDDTETCANIKCKCAPYRRKQNRSVCRIALLCSVRLVLLRLDLLQQGVQTVDDDPGHERRGRDPPVAFRAPLATKQQLRLQHVRVLVPGRSFHCTIGTRCQET